METNVIIESTHHCYCSTTELDRNMIPCTSCKKYFHPICLKSGQPSPLAGDVYFIFTCENCSRTGAEVVKRKKLQWTMVIILALYNLQLQGGGKCGYYRWREHICCFIDKYWNVFFKEDRKKSATWHGTVAGALSSGANRFFLSGMEVLKETGWWSLKSTLLPSFEEMDIVMQGARPRKRQSPTETVVVLDGHRKRQGNIVEAAVALKEKKASLPGDGVCKPKKKRTDSKSKKNNPLDLPIKHKLKLVVSNTESSNPINCSEDSSFPKFFIKKDNGEPSYNVENLNLWLHQPCRELDDLNVDTDVPAEIFDTPTTKDPPETATSFFGSLLSEFSCDKTSIKLEYESGEEDSNSSKTTGMMKKHHHPDTSRKRKAVTRDESPVKEIIPIEPSFKLMNSNEEEQLLQKLQEHPSALSERFDVRRLYRKLMVRKLKRERNIPLFDLDAEVRTLRGMDPPEYSQDLNPTKDTVSVRSNSILDRYQIGLHSTSYGRLPHHSSFITRLMGIVDEEESSIVSPYTERILKPYIFRDYDTKPVKVKLMEELLAHTNRNNPDWEPPPHSPIDYCYIRPQHIPGVNALCQEFFWPGIDMSESLQYPDFTCVALYKKVIIGFAFMVPDVKYNEAYISFIFCHPEWRRCGIATFMLYHLIQTCMGKDVTLHVSASSPAMFLYQKFGFKIEELIHNFYEKYLPAESKDCRHAVFLRLSR